LLLSITTALSQQVTNFVAGETEFESKDCHPQMIIKITAIVITIFVGMEL
jgi:hypothetical protein